MKSLKFCRLVTSPSSSPPPPPPPPPPNPEELKELWCPERQLEGGRIPVHATFTACCLSVPAEQTSPAADAAKISALALSTATTTDLTGGSTSNLPLPNAHAGGRRGTGLQKGDPTLVCGAPSRPHTHARALPTPFPLQAEPCNAGLQRIRKRGEPERQVQEYY
ncbi:hypothetical protein MHYP_G00189050 [Metynnis hypsauchen]